MAHRNPATIPLRASAKRTRIAADCDAPLQPLALDFRTTTHRASSPRTIVRRDRTATSSFREASFLRRHFTPRGQPELMRACAIVGSIKRFELDSLPGRGTTTRGMPARGSDCGGCAAR
jgi:hypothetical protein